MTKSQRNFRMSILLVTHIITTASPLLASPSSPKELTRYPERTGVHADVILAKQFLQVGRKHMAEGRYRAACTLLEKSLDLDATPQAKFALAQCYDKTDRHARAWSLLEDIANTSKIPTHAALARELMTAIAPGVGKGIIFLPQPGNRPSGLQIHVDGKTVDNEQWRETGRFEMVLDVGEHVVMATARGKTPWQRSFLVTSHDKPITVSVPELGDEQPLSVPNTASAATSSPLIVPLASLGAFAFTIGITAFVVGTVEQKFRADLFIPSSAFLALGGMSIAGSIWLSSGSTKSSNTTTAQGIPLHVIANVGANHGHLMVQGYF